jgi:DNA-binding beta-propeller fold protein YncE
VLRFTVGQSHAEAVYGQPSMFDQFELPVSASSLHTPGGIWFDGVNGGLFVADTGANRVLYFGPNDVIASIVWGQGGDFTTNSASGCTADTLNGPLSVALEPISGRLFIADTGMHFFMWLLAKTKQKQLQAIIGYWFIQTRLI